MEMITPLGNYSVVEKHDVTLECEVSKPDAKPLWYKGKKLIKPDDRFIVKVRKKLSRVSDFLVSTDISQKQVIL